MIVVTVLSLVLVVLAPPLPAPGYSVSADHRPADGRGDARLHPPADAAAQHHRRRGAAARRAVLGLHVHAQEARARRTRSIPASRATQFLFNLCIAVVAIPVNLVASLPGAGRELVAGRLHSRVPATLLIALGAFFPTLTDSLNRAGSTDLYQVGKFLGVLFLFAGFLVSVEVFREVRIPFTSIRLGDGAPRTGPAPGRGDPRGRDRDPAAHARVERRGAVQPLTSAREAGPAARHRGIDPPAAMLSPMDGPTDGAPVEAPARIRVLLVDDHAVVRRGLHGFFELLDDIEVVGEAEDGRRAVELVGTLQPDVVLMDLLMPVMDGIAATAEIKARYPDVEVVALTSFIEEERVTAALEAGATGYLLKDADADDVAVAVRRAQAGEVHLDPQVARLLANRIRTRRDGAPAARAADRARARGPVAGRQGPLQQGDRRDPRHHRADRADPRLEHPRQARPRQPDAGGAVGDRAPRGLTGGTPRRRHDGRPAGRGPRSARPTRPPIVFVHGTRLTRNHWWPQLRRLVGPLPVHRHRPARATASGRASRSR